MGSLPPDRSPQRPLHGTAAPAARGWRDGGRPSSVRRWLASPVQIIITILVVGLFTVLTALLVGGLSGGRDESATGPGAGDDAALLTPEQAQQGLSFPLVLPDAIPGAFTFAGVQVEFLSTATNHPSDGAMLWFHAREERRERVSVLETTASVTTPDAHAMQETLLRSAPQQPSTPLPEPSQATMVIHQQEILKTVIYTDTATPLLIYSWNQGELHFDVTAMTGQHIGEAEVEQLVTALVAEPSPR